MRKILAIALAAALAACGSERTVEFDDEGGEGSYTVDTSTGETRGTIETADGTVEFRSGSDAKVDLPGGFDLYPGAKIMSNTTVNNDGGKGAMVLFETSDSPDKVLAHYRKRADAADIEIKLEMTTAQGKMIAGETEGGLNFSLNANDQGDKTLGQLTVAEGMN